MTPSSLISDLAALGVVARVEGGQLALMPASRVPRELLEAIRANKVALLEILTKPRPAVIPTEVPATLERRGIWRALHQSIPDCLEMMAQDRHLIAWLEYRTASKYWVSTPPVTADRATLERLVLTVATGNPDALIVALKSARGLHPEINPARQEVAQRARFSRKAVSA